MDFVLGFDKFYPNIKTYSMMGLNRGSVQSWEKEEFGITRYPTNVIAVTHHSTISEKLPAVESMVWSNRLQWEALRVAREIPETVGGKLEEYGAIFLTSASPEKSHSLARLEIRDRVEEIRRSLERRTGMRLWVGVGSTFSPGDQLVDSRRQAVLSMNLCGSLGLPVVFYEDYAGQMSRQGRSSLNSFLRRLLTVYQKGSPEERETAREEYIRRALSSSNERGEKLRMYLLEAVFILVEALRGRFLSERDLDTLVDSMEKKLEGARTLQDMLAIFREGLDLVTKIMARPLEGKRSILIEQVKEYVDRNMAGNLRIGDLAKRIGLSKPAFLAGFRRITGQGFSQYLQRSRIEEAKHMLGTSTIRVSRVAQECGFNSLSYFIQAFKRATGLSPRRYRATFQK
jgi:two-component system response regulator YesN